MDFLQIITNNLIYTAQTVYTTIPAILANIAPLFVKDVPLLNIPLDFGLTINGKTILGKNKTFRGLIAGIMMSMIIMSIEYVIWLYTPFKHLGIIDFNTVNFLSIGFWMGFGVIMGDAIASFIKRRLNVPPGGSVLFLDQLDCVIGGLAFGRIAWAFPLKYGIIIITLTFFMHIAGRHIGYYLGIADSKW